MRILGIYVYRHVISYVFYVLALASLAMEFAESFHGGRQLFVWAIGTLVFTSLSIHFRLQSFVPLSKPLFVVTAYFMIALLTVGLIVF